MSQRTTILQRFGILLLFCAALATSHTPANSQPPERTILEGVTVGGSAALYAPLHELATALALPLTGTEPRLVLEEEPVGTRGYDTLPDDTTLVRLRLLAERPELGVSVEWDPAERAATVRYGEREVLVHSGRRTLLEAVTFARDPERLHVPVPELCRALDLPENGPESNTTGSPTLADGTPLSPVTGVKEPVTLSWFKQHAAARLALNER